MQTSETTQNKHQENVTQTITTAKECRSAFWRKQLDGVKNGVRIEVAARYYGEFKLAGAGRLLGRCVSPEHEDKTPSMHIFTDDQHFKCFGIGCGAHGDVLDLVMLAEGCELWVAMVTLSKRYGIERPERPPPWFRRQERQAPVRDGIEEVMARHVQRRLFRVFFLHEIEKIEIPAERQAEKARVWEDLAPIARSIVRGRRAS